MLGSHDIVEWRSIDISVCMLSVCERDRQEAKEFVCKYS